MEAQIYGNYHIKNDLCTSITDATVDENKSYNEERIFKRTECKRLSKIRMRE